ncbi:MAG: rhomboid family intramembrane serine protease [Crocinitomicaceae bacterium]|jgi:membrane associated rhomboid family serine protease
MNLFSNIPQVTKNLLILNILFFVAKYVLKGKVIDLDHLFGAYYPNSPLFKPFQIITYFFMHGDFFHILFNMLMLVMFGASLERLWGPKRYFVFYVVTAVGAYVINSLMGTIQLMEIKNQLTTLGYNLTDLEYSIKNQDLSNISILNFESVQIIENYIIKSKTSMIGASGAIYGIMAAFAYLFPNTELMLMFPPIPVKAKFLIPIYFLIEIYSNFHVNDNIAHMAHIGGGLTGLILVYFWKKNRNYFY